MLSKYLMVAAVAMSAIAQAGDTVIQVNNAGAPRGSLTEMAAMQGNTGSDPAATPMPTPVPTKDVAVTRKPIMKRETSRDSHDLPRHHDEVMNGPRKNEDTLRKEASIRKESTPQKESALRQEKDPRKESTRPKENGAVRSSSNNNGRTAVRQPTKELNHEERNAVRQPKKEKSNRQDRRELSERVPDHHDADYDNFRAHTGMFNDEHEHLEHEFPVVFESHVVATNYPHDHDHEQFANRHDIHEVFGRHELPHHDHNEVMPSHKRIVNDNDMRMGTTHSDKHVTRHFNDDEIIDHPTVHKVMDRDDEFVPASKIVSKGKHDRMDNREHLPAHIDYNMDHDVKDDIARHKRH